jgi:hypothetical protein
MRLAEFYDVDEINNFTLQIGESFNTLATKVYHIIRYNHSTAAGYFYTYLQEVFVNGQNRDVWCGSRRVITDNMMYDKNTGPDRAVSGKSCYKFIAGCKMLADQSACEPNDVFIYAASFVCMPVDQQ